MLYKFLLLLTATIVSTSSLAGPSCDWKPIKTETTKSNDYSLQVVTLDCNIDYYKNDNVTAKKAVIRDVSDKIVADRIGNWGSNNEYYADEVSIVDTPKGFPHQVILTSVYGGSNISHTYHIYSTDFSLKRIAKIHQPVNKWQANKRSGSEKEVVGFYEDNNEFFIDRMTIKETEVAKCNSCQTWNVETLKIVENRMVLVGVRAFDIDDFEGDKLRASNINEGIIFFGKLFDMFKSSKDTDK